MKVTNQCADHNYWFPRDFNKKYKYLDSSTHNVYDYTSTHLMIQKKHVMSKMN